MIAPFDYGISIESDRVPEPLNITFAVTDLDIYEHIDLPFLTAKMALLDEQNFFERFDILGGEKVTVSLRSRKDKEPMNSKGEIKLIKKIFFISSVKSSHRGDDNRAQTILFNMIEDVGFNSNLLNLNKVYKGKCSDIIKKITSNFLGREVDTEGKDIQNLKVIVPNLSPLNGCLWLTNRATTVEGYPFFFYSTLVDKNLQFNDLGTLMLDRQPANPTDDNGDAPTFKYSKALSGSNDVSAFNTIYDYQHRDTENLFDLIKKGSIGSKQQFINSSGSSTIANQSFDFDISGDTLDAFAAKLPNKQTRPLYDKAFGFNDKKSRTITQFGGSNSHRTTKSSTFDLSYSESLNLAEYKNGVKSQAYYNLMHKSPLIFSATGLHFMDGLHNNTLGRKINLEFLPTDQFDIPEQKDRKFSGEYLIIRAQHVIKRERYDITFTGARFSNMEIPEAKAPTNAMPGRTVQ